jgi:hypothetical protein
MTARNSKEKFWQSKDFLDSLVGFWIRGLMLLAIGYPVMTFLGFPLLSWVHYKIWYFLSLKEHINLIKFSIPLALVWGTLNWVAVRLGLGTKIKEKKPD